MSASAIADTINVSKTFACKTIRLAKKDKSLLVNKVTSKKSVQERSMAQSLPIENNLQILDITDQFNSVVKSNEIDEISSPPISMRFTTSNGTIIEVFS